MVLLHTWGMHTHRHPPSHAAHQQLLEHSRATSRRVQHSPKEIISNKKQKERGTRRVGASEWG